METKDPVIDLFKTFALILIETVHVPHFEDGGRGLRGNIAEGGLLCVEVTAEGEGSQFLFSDADCTVSPLCTAFFSSPLSLLPFPGLIYLKSSPSGNLEHSSPGEVICVVSSLNNIPLKRSSNS